MESVNKLSTKIFSLDGGGNLESGREKGRSEKGTLINWLPYP